MSNEEEKKEKPSISIGGIDTGGGDAVIGDQHKGDKIEGNKNTGNIIDSGGGDIKDNTITQSYVGGDEITVDQAVKDVFASLSEVCEPLPEAKDKEPPRTIPTPGEEEKAVAVSTEDDSLPDPILVTEFEEDLSDHPENVYAAVSKYSAMSPEEIEAVPEEEKESLGKSITSMFSKVGSVAVKGLTASAPIALKVIGATASPVFPLNLVGAALEGFMESQSK